MCQQRHAGGISLTMKYECRIIGVNPLWISVLLVGAFLPVCAFGGNGINWGYLGFEVIFPFYASIAVGEWCKTRTDPMFDVISAQGRFLFSWILRRFALLSGMICAFAFIGMIGVSTIIGENSFLDMACAFLPTAFVLSSACVFISLLSNIPHIPTMAVGVVWLFSIMSMSLLRFPPMQCIYLFARYAGVEDTIWIVNKIILTSVGGALWIGIFLCCKNRLWE